MPNKTRCNWSTNEEIYLDYHDNEWGRPLHDDKKLFAMLILEGAQAGLSWITILKRREGYYQVFDNLDPEIVAKYSQHKLDEIITDTRIIRNRLKVASAVTNAKAYLDIKKQGQSFNDYLWKFVNGKQIQNSWQKLSQVPANTPESDAMSKALKKLGFKFVGSTICYAFMQAVGMVNDHVVDCHCYKLCGGTRL